MTNPTKSTDTARRLAEAESNLQTAVTNLDRLQADTQTQPDELAVDLSNARETLAICERRAEVARANHRAALIQAVEVRASAVEANAAAIEDEAAGVSRAVETYLTAQGFAPGLVENLLARQKPARAVELLASAQRLRDAAYAARKDAKSNPAFALRELEQEAAR